MTPTKIHTLAEHVAEGKPPVQEVLRLAMSLAEALRRIHDDGRVHGALTPSRVELTSSGVELLPGQPDATPYTAPEVLRGRPADARADIFSFGAIVYEMITGRAPFDGNTPETLLASMVNAPPPATGSRALDALLVNCLAKDPAARWQRIQKAQLELKLLTVSARRTESPQRESVAAQVRAEVQQAVAARIAGRLDAQDKTIAEFQQAITASLQAVQAHLCTIDAKLTAGQEGTKRSDEAIARLNVRISGVEERGTVPVERIANTELLLHAAAERVSRIEQTTESVRQQAAEFAETAALQLHAIEQTVRSQADALESARTALAQTDDLVERVVEALDSLQSIVLERSEDHASGVS
jgi:eukaryotic-like serine/threonine-protein kinase